METFGERLHQLRKKKGLSLEALAKHFGLGKNATSSWETGKSKPNADDLVILAELLETTTDYLLRGVEKIEENEKKFQKLYMEALEKNNKLQEQLIDYVTNKNTLLKNDSIISYEGELAN
jgi:transcriptional regulator with XRE-family HTH domain